MDLGLRALGGEIRQVLGTAESSGKNQCTVVSRSIFSQSQQGIATSCNPRALDLDVAGRTFRHLPRGMIHDVHLLDGRGEALPFGSAFLDSKQGKNGFVNLGSVEDSATGENNGYLFLSFFHFFQDRC